MKGRGLLAIFGLFLLGCGARSNDVRVRGAWQYHEDSVIYNITFADNHAYVQTMSHVDEPVTGNWRIDGNHLIITTGMKNDQSPSTDTSEIVKLDDESMILKAPPDSLNRKLKTLFKVK